MNKLYKHQQEIRKLCKKHNISDEVKVELLSIVSYTYNDGMEIGWEVRNKDENKKCRFDIDFYEFSFLAEACIPPRPIARAMFWHDVIDKYYHLLTPDERERLYEWISRNPSYQESLENRNEDCILFKNRYNPDNQYIVTTIYEGQQEEKECFKHFGRYHLSRTTSINNEYIINVKKTTDGDTTN